MKTLVASLLVVASFLLAVSVTNRQHYFDMWSPDVSGITLEPGVYITGTDLPLGVVTEVRGSTMTIRPANWWERTSYTIGTWLCFISDRGTEHD